jgi:hypothetical protein
LALTSLHYTENNELDHLMLRQSQLKISRGAAGLDSAMRQPALFGFDLRFSTSSGLVDAAADGPSALSDDGV